LNENPSNRFLFLCAVCKKKHDSETLVRRQKKKLIDPELIPLQEKNLSLTIDNNLLNENIQKLLEDNNVLIKRIKLLETSNANLTESVNIVNRCRINPTVSNSLTEAPNDIETDLRELLNKAETQLTVARFNVDQLNLDNSRLRNLTSYDDVLKEYRSSFYKMESLYSNKHKKSPRDGLFCLKLILRGHRFIIYVGDKKQKPAGNVKDVYSKQDVKYLLHLDKFHILDCSRTSQSGICMASKINTIQGLFNNGIAAKENAKILPARNGVISVVALEDIPADTEIFVRTYGRGHIINEEEP
jgi:hypothetical protein